LNQEVGEGSKKRKLEEVAPDQEVVEPVEAPYEDVEESDGSLEVSKLFGCGLTRLQNIALDPRYCS
jgi:hypothetical protein